MAESIHLFSYTDRGLSNLNKCFLTQIACGIAPYRKGVLMEDTKNTFFGYKSDETTAMQTKNNMMVILHIQVIWFGCFVTSYLCSSLFLGHYSHEDLVVHFLDFLKIFNFSTDLLLNIGLDGPNKTFVPKKKVINHRYWFISNPYSRWSVSRSSLLHQVNVRSGWSCNWIGLLFQMVCSLLWGLQEVGIYHRDHSTFYERAHGIMVVQHWKVTDRNFWVN